MTTLPASPPIACTGALFTTLEASVVALPTTLPAPALARPIPPLTNPVKPVACDMPDKICPVTPAVPRARPAMPDTFRKFPSDDVTPPRYCPIPVFPKPDVRALAAVPRNPVIPVLPPGC